LPVARVEKGEAAEGEKPGRWVEKKEQGDGFSTGLSGERRQRAEGVKGLRKLRGLLMIWSLLTTWFTSPKLV